MGLGSIFKFIFRRAIQIFIIGVLLVVIPNLPPYANVSQPFSLTPTKPFSGKLALNNRLKDVEVWHKGDFVGAECFADYNGELYTGLLLGDVVKLTNEHITPVVKFGKPCKGLYEEAKCGRPLGLEFNNEGTLFVADAYYGLFQVNVKTGEKKNIVSPKTKIAGKEPKLFNSLTLASNGDIFWTDSSTDFQLQDGLYSFLTDPTGRLIHYDAKTKSNKVLIDNLHFANGVALSADEEFVIVAESVRNQIHRYYLKGPKKGTHDVFISGLPGAPDNLKADGKGGFFIPLIIPVDSDHPALYISVGPFPRLRKAVVRFIGLFELLFKKIFEVYPNEFSEKAVYFIGSFGSSHFFTSQHRVTLLRVDRNGQIIDSLHHLDKKISAIAEMHVLKDVLYLGSPFNDYIAKISLDKVGWTDLKGERVKRSLPTTPKPAPSTTPKPTTTATPKPTTTTPKPTTTTPKPTTTTPKPTTTTPKPATTTKATTTTPKPTTTAPKPSTTTPRPTTTAKPVTTTAAPKSTPAPAKTAPTPKSPPPTPKSPPPTPKPAPQQKVPPSQAKPAAVPKQQSPPSQQTPPAQAKPKPAQPQPTVKN